MKITEKISSLPNGKSFYSFEYFPPKTEQARRIGLIFFTFLWLVILLLNSSSVFVLSGSIQFVRQAGSYVMPWPIVCNFYLGSWWFNMWAHYGTMLSCSKHLQLGNMYAFNMHQYGKREAWCCIEGDFT